MPKIKTTDEQPTAKANQQVKPPQGTGIFEDLIPVYTSDLGTQFVRSLDILTEDVLERIKRRNAAVFARQRNPVTGKS